MNCVPDAILQHILSFLRNARDIAACSCVSKRWRDSVPYIPSLYFPRNAFDGVVRVDGDTTIGRMISNVVKLEELVIYCPFLASSLVNWLSACNWALRVLELRMDSIGDKDLFDTECAAEMMDALFVAKGLEELRLWGVTMIKSPNWGTFSRLRILEIIGAALRDGEVQDILRACPNLSELALLGCDGVGSVLIELERLEKCRLDFLGIGNCYLLLSSPKLQVLEVQGFSWIQVNPKHHIHRLCVAKNAGRVYNVDVGKLAELDYLSLRGVQWSWSAISSILQSASEVKHLAMKIEFCGDYDMLQPFPQIDLVDFFNNHPKLEKFEIHGALFAALSQKNSLKNLDSRFVIPCLEEVFVTVRSPLNAEQKLSTLESLVTYSVKLRKMSIRISQMKNCHETADDFFKEICKFKCINYRIVHIE